MAGIEKMEAWKTTDGEVFSTLDEAEYHTRKLDFIEWYAENPLCTYRDRKQIVPSVRVIEWLRENHTRLKQFVI